MRVILIVLFLCGVSLPAHAQIRITDDPGGSIHAYIDFYTQVRKAGYRIIVDGRCASACTLLMHYVPRNRVCVTNRAVFGFHAAFFTFALTGQYVGHSREATEFMMNSYPPIVQQWIIQNGGLTREVKWMPAGALKGFYRRC